MIKRIYDSILAEHLKNNRQMAFLCGPRQVGKTTTSLTHDDKTLYVNWDNQKERQIIIKGPDNFIEHHQLNVIGSEHTKIVFDEIHKYAKWKTFLKGFFDIYGEKFKIIVTGSACLNFYKRGGDSLMGRYFLYRMHPLSVAELITSDIIENEIRPPQPVTKELIDQLLIFGGFPEPFAKADNRFYNRWKRVRAELLFKEDLRDLTNIHEIAQIEMLAELLKNQTGQLVNYSTLASAINVSVDTIRRWLSALESLYYCYTIRPWFKNVPKSLRKQPKIFLWDWSLVQDQGARYENFVASHLLKSVHYWTDMGFGDFGLYFLRDKEKREVDFLVTRQGQPWLLVEVKSSPSQPLSPQLKYFKKLLNTEHTFQACFDSEYLETDCFLAKEPVKIPVATLLSQLI